jgi:hypothetical protein
MYNKFILRKLIDFIENLNGINDKNLLSKRVKIEFNLTIDRKVFYCKDFAIRFSKSLGKSFPNTVLSFSALQKYDNKPMIICFVSPKENYLLLANTTFLSKISHSSHELRVDNIKGSFNGSDILREIASIENRPSNFDKLMTIHESFSFEENLQRLVEATNNIVGQDLKFTPNQEEFKNLMNSPVRTKNFLSSKFFNLLNEDLDFRVNRVKNEILIAAFIENVNIRGRLIEYLITGNEYDHIWKNLIDSLNEQNTLPNFKTQNTLGDYTKDFDVFLTETDIKTKVLFLDSNPKAYNIDKILRFLSQKNSVYMIYIVGIDERRNIKTVLCPMFNKQLIDSTVAIHHWAGRNSRGVTQFFGNGLNKIIQSYEDTVDINHSMTWIEKLLSL